ncbi:hypothetical protein FACS1894189_2720 [Planctomycetales bacterium]|nr:hypothetical protein FACS1894189_2720 [Planctomycetales bacterium]
MTRLTLLTVLSAFLCADLTRGDVGDCFWGGINEQTTYMTTYVPGMGAVELAQLPQPSINLGAPLPDIPVQATPTTNASAVPQANIPTITIPTGPVGTVGRTAGTQNTLPQAPPGLEIVYVLPAQNAPDAVCLDGVKSIPATEVQVVPANTPGAIPVALKTVTVQRPKVEYHWTYSPITTKTDTLVKAVDPRTGRVVRTYCQSTEESSSLYWFHRQETVTYETVTAKVGTPVSLAPAAATSTNTVIQGGQSTAVPYQSQYPHSGDNSHLTVIEGY